MPKYYVHKAVNLDKVVKANRLTIPELEKRYEAQWKYDGCNVSIDVNQQRSYSRTGEEVKSLGQVERLLTTFPQLNNMVVLGEAWHPTWDFSKINGEFRRYAESDGLWFVMFDCLTKDEWTSRASGVPYAARMERLRGVRVDVRCIPAHRKPPGSYDALDLLTTMGVTPGYDGLILRDPLGLWKAGSGTTGEIIRLKNKLSFDLRITGMKEGEAGGKHAGRMGAISVDFKGKKLWVGTGFSDKERELYHSYFRDDYLGKIAEVEALDYSSDGLLREPRFKGIRHDKLEADD